MISYLGRYIKVHGVRGVIDALSGRFIKFKANSYKDFFDVLSNSSGLEIGGPSKVFSSKGFFPVYPIAGTLDNCTYRDNTIWEGHISEGKTFHYHISCRPGHQYILEATNLHAIDDDSYDFLLSSHVIEHLANPLKGISEWKRVVKPGGILVVVVPHKDRTFDHLRPVTSFEHLLDDYSMETTEADLTHFEETLRLHDLMLDKGVKDLSSFKKRLAQNYETRCMHHHVFNSPLLSELLDHAGLQILNLEPVRTGHILGIARKLQDLGKPTNDRFLDRNSSIYSRSPFQSDHNQ